MGGTGAQPNMGGPGSGLPRAWAYPPVASNFPYTGVAIPITPESQVGPSITCWIGPNGMAIVTISAVLQVPSGETLNFAVYVNGFAATLIAEQNKAATSEWRTPSGTRLLVAANYIKPNALNVFTPAANSATDSGYISNGCMIVQPL